MKKTQAARLENQVYSNRVARSEFDNNWKTSVTRSGYVVYTATTNNAKILVLLTTGLRKLIIFNKGGKVLVGSGGVSHYSKPHKAKDLN
ncbi:hypothetical protein [Paenibacillus sp. Soil750]|uniref:hypothetical protein n=1 Tax=Paenibacillus sp. Soil750 TaxID=1736398 RepID=UPI0006F1FE0A|nr:hypothetical protein [Paenibacillus sp. Soil750]KRE59721.1 hypothetical protein ASL11_26235 [Paenibacillus sp. Soil750]